jgi:hypothetical protein
MKSRIKIVLAVVLIITLAGIGAAVYLFNLEHKDLHRVNPDFITTASDLQKAFEENEVSATSKYVNRIVEVNGIIESIKTGEENVLNVTLKTGSDFSSVICTFPDATYQANLISGNQVTIRGECSGFLMDVLLNNCILVK